MKIASLFSGAGGLDLGFRNAGFEIAFANEYDADIWETYEKNHGEGILDKRSILEVKSDEMPEVDGIIGGPPCQSWSLAGSMGGIKDPRGKLFYEYIRILGDKKPLFFLAENVAGILSSTHKPQFLRIVRGFEELGYNVSYKLLDAKDFGVPQERKRVIIVGYRKDLGRSFIFPDVKIAKKTLKETIGNLPESKPAHDKNHTNGQLQVPNHEHMNGGFSTIYMSRNRRRGWNEQSFTIQAGGRHAPLHPDSSPMACLGPDAWEFAGKNKGVRRLSVRECARIQTFPDDFIFYYDNVAKGYKMIGNAVPVKMAEILALKIMADLKDSLGNKIYARQNKQKSKKQDNVEN